MLVFSLHWERSIPLIHFESCLISGFLAPWWWKSYPWWWRRWRLALFFLFTTVRGFEISLTFPFESIGSFRKSASLLFYCLLPINFEYGVGRWILHQLLVLSFNEQFFCPSLQQRARENGWRELGQVLLVLIVFEHGTWHGIRLEEGPFEWIRRCWVWLWPSGYCTSSVSYTLVPGVVGFKKSFNLLPFIFNKRSLGIFIIISEVELTLEATSRASIGELICNRRYRLKAMQAFHGPILWNISHPASCSVLIRVLRSLSLTYHVIILSHLPLILYPRGCDIIASLKPLEHHLVSVVLKLDLLQLLTQELVLFLTLEVPLVDLAQLIVRLLRPLSLI